MDSIEAMYNWAFQQYLLEDGCLFEMCWGLNSHCFPIVLHTHYEDSPLKVG